MDYFTLLNLKKEPFSNSPDPEVFFRSRQHLACLQQLEIALRLRRGLNLVIGDIGTGKTTLCRRLINRFAEEPEVQTHLILDPSFETPDLFWRIIGETFGLLDLSKDEKMTVPALKESIQHYLFLQGAEKGKTIILIIDEGQKMPPFCAEILRELLNYETNEHKLLQIVIFGQPEFEVSMAAFPNFTDRINLLFRLGPLGFTDTRLMIRYRLERAASDGQGALPVFSLPGIWTIYRITRGYPRRIIHLCHHCLLAMIVQNRSRVTRKLVISCARRGAGGYPGKKGERIIWAALLLCFVALTGVLIAGGAYQKALGPKGTIHEEVSSEKGWDMPEMLGEISVHSGETMGELIRQIYGTARPDILAAVHAANPHIPNPHRLSIGERIIFPAISFPHQKSDGQKRILVEIDSGKDLEEIYNRIRRPDQNLRASLLPCWSREEGLRFSLVAEQGFSDVSSALDWIREQQLSGAKIFSPKKEKFLLFADLDHLLK